MRLLFPFADDIRLKCFATMPGVAIVGAAIGATLAYTSQGDIGSAMLWFAAALCVSSYISALAEAATIAVLPIDPSGINGDIIAFAWDLIAGAVAGVFLSAVASVDLLQTIGAASSILFLQQLVLDKLVLGNLAGETLAAIVHGGGGGTQPEYSLADAQAARGDYSAAHASFEQAIRANPDDVAPYRALARMLRLDAADYAGANLVLTRALSRARIDAATREALVREQAELLMHHLNAPGQAARLLARYIDQTHQHRNVEWARSQLKVAKQLALPPEPNP
jgi:tetratricopeptide (TPR) repeat protein